jgi:hypothetical protein
MMFLGDIPKPANYARAYYHRHDCVAKRTKQNAAPAMLTRKEV